MPEIILLFVLLIPQIVAGVFAKSIGKSFWFWFFISFLIPIISLVVLLFLDNKNEQKTSYQLAEHVGKKHKSKSPD